MIEPDVHRSQLGRRPQHYVNTGQESVSQEFTVSYNIIARIVTTYFHFSATAARAGYDSHLAFAQAVISHFMKSWPLMPCRIWIQDAN